MLTPVDLERDYGMTGGHWHHLELSLDQVMMMRPFPGRPSMPAALTVFTCTCGAGRKNAAREILRRGGGMKAGSDATMMLRTPFHARVAAACELQ